MLRYTTPRESEPPAVAGGHEVIANRFQGYGPPATAGGSDYPFTQTTCLISATTSTRSFWFFITASIDL